MISPAVDSREASTIGGAENFTGNRTSGVLSYNIDPQAVFISMLDKVTFFEQTQYPLCS